MFQVLEDVQTPELKPMESVGKFVAENKDLLNNFFKYAKSLKNAVGLASNQVGLEDRFIALKTTSGWTLAINPTIVTASGKIVRKVEGCLSWPDKDIVANRSERVVIDYFTIKGANVRRVVTDNFEAQVWQHEINHLNGVEEVIVTKPKTIINETPKVGRNDPCSCGSQKKYKKCCG